MCRNEPGKSAVPVTPTAQRLPIVDRDAATCTRRCLNSRELLGSAHELLIEHNGSLYTLRVTRQGKLILTK